jgi:hypothetical protein
MTDNQIQTLVDILEEEKRKLEEVDRRNQSLINQL